MKRLHVRPAARISLLYIITAALWILFSDSVVERFAPSPALLTALQTSKGWFFVATTGTILYFLLKAEIGRRERSEDALRRAYEALERKVAEQARAEQALRESEEKFRVMYSEALDVILIVDAESGMIVNANPAARRILGYADDALLSRHFSVLFPTTSDLTHQQYLAALRTREAVFESQGFLRADGTVCPMDMTATMVAWGATQAILLTLRDVTERKQAEDALHATEEHLRLVLQNMPVMLEAQDSKRNILVWNRECER
jgi:PAS domain S-box-containing protein